MNGALLALGALAVFFLFWFFKSRSGTVDDAMDVTIIQAQDIGESKAELVDTFDDVEDELDAAAGATDAAVEVASGKPEPLKDVGGGLKIGIQRPTDLGES